MDLPSKSNQILLFLANSQKPFTLREREGERKRRRENEGGEGVAREREIKNRLSSKKKEVRN